MLKSLRPVEIFMLEKLLSNEESLTDCVDSMFEEPGSFKQYNEFPTDDDYPSDHSKVRASDQLNANSNQLKSMRTKCLKRSSSLPNLTCTQTRLNELDKCSLRHNMTTDDQMLNDEIDASFKTITKRIKKCVSQILVKKQQTVVVIYENNHFSERDQFNHQPSESHQCPQFNDQHYLNVNQQQQQFNNSIATSSQQSNSPTGSPSSVDSYEISLALNAKGSNYISALAKQLLHKLFVSISGIADQLQSNFASDLRQILKLVFILHTSAIDEADNASLEEAEEALESTNFTTSKTSNFEEMLNNSENLQLLFSTTLNAIENAQTNNSANLPREETVDEFNHHEDYNGEFVNIYENNMYENYSADYNPHRSSINSSINQATTTEDLTRYRPLWVADQLISECTKCKIEFTLLRRRHHCRQCKYSFHSLIHKFHSHSV